jgi:phosphoribosylpyrophosphate synthetase
VNFFLFVCCPAVAQQQLHSVCLISNYVCSAGVLPCLPYSQQTKMRRRGNISLKLIAEMCVKAGFTHIITIDLHSKVIIVFFFSQCFGSGSALILVGWIRIHEGKKDL